MTLLNDRMYAFNKSVFKLLCSGGPRYKPLGVSRGYPWLICFIYIHLYAMHLFVCGDHNQFSSIYWIFECCHYTLKVSVMT